LGTDIGPGSKCRLNALDHSDPEPDVAVTVKPPESYSQDHPTTVLLAAEISDSSLRLDRRKAGLYAAAEVPDIGSLISQSRRLEVHRLPVADAKQEFGYRYAEVRELGEDETIAPLGAAGREDIDQEFFE